MKTDFIWGAQYYRAPTPDRKFWRQDLANMKALGFTDIKYWVQWRWSHRDENEFYFDDTDELMDLAHEYGLRVTLNTIFDVTPVWFLNKYPEAKQITASGASVAPYASACRQIGGMPGPCYNHEAGIAERKKFMAELVRRYASHPAMYMWDVWNEPEQCHCFRRPNDSTLTCYCPSCQRKFKEWLAVKYGTVEALNEKWGRFYRNFDEVELPQNPHTFGDFIDFREFHLDTMTAEAAWRLDTVHKYDKKHKAYLHVVPNNSRIFSAVTGVDDFALAEKCDAFASTNFAKPIWSVLTCSAANGKPAYNVECHIASGSTKMHPKIIELSDLVRDFASQIGMGLRGFMFWQYHTELLGIEAPAWGTVKPDGSIGSVGRAAERFFASLSPYISDIADTEPPRAQVAIWKGRRNELFSYAVNGALDDFAEGIEAYVNALYAHNFNCKIVDDGLIKSNGLDGVRLLILPESYELDGELAAAIDAFVRKGGTVLCEAHLGGYNADTNRHSETMPGCGLSEAWGIRECETTSAYRLKSNLGGSIDTSALNDDVKKALDAYGSGGGKYFVMDKGGKALIGAERFAELEFERGEALAEADGRVCMARIPVGKGSVYYCGTNIGEGAAVESGAFAGFLCDVCRASGVHKNTEGAEDGVHTDVMSGGLLVAVNTADTEKVLRLDTEMKSIFFDKSSENKIYILPPNSADILKTAEI